MAVAIDPVCRMEVDEGSAPATSVYQGRSYFFCAPGCKTAFDHDPERYLRHAEADAAVEPEADVTDPSARARIALPVDAAIRTRRSITRFTPDPVPHDAVERMLDAAVWAPNHHLTEPWEFVVLGPRSRQRLAEIRRKFRRTLFKNPDAPEAQRAADKVYADTIATPVIIVVTTTDPTDPDLRDDDYGATLCAIQNMLLVATGLGLGSYLRTGQLIHDPALHELIGLAEGRRVAGIVYAGYPAHAPQRRRTPYAQRTRRLD